MLKSLNNLFFSVKREYKNLNNSTYLKQGFNKSPKIKMLQWAGEQKARIPVLILLIIRFE